MSAMQAISVACLVALPWLLLAWLVALLAWALWTIWQNSWTEEDE
jgi:uncharacterized membrane protein YbhN (UPF0104 family)